MLQQQQQQQQVVLAAHMSSVPSRDLSKADCGTEQHKPKLLLLSTTAETDLVHQLNAQINLDRCCSSVL